MLSLIAVFFLAGQASAQHSPVSPQEEVSVSVESHQCGDRVTTACLVGEIQSFLAADMDPFRRQRTMLALAQAQLADGLIEQALSSYAQLEAKTARAEFLVSYARNLIAEGDNESALERLREADTLLTDGQSDLDRLNVTRQSRLIAEAFAQAGSGEEGRAILDGIAAYRNLIPLNPMFIALMLQVAEAEAEIGFRAEAAAIVEETYALMLDQDVEVTPELILQIFETWASIDAAAATEAAEELATIIGKHDPSAFEFAIWTGLSSGLVSSGDGNTAFLQRAQASLNDAPGRVTALLLAPKLADAIREADEGEQARLLLERAHVEAMTLPSPIEKAAALFALAEAFARADSPEQAENILNELLVMSEQAGPEGAMLRHFANAVPAQLASLGKVDEAYELAMNADSGIREMAMMTVADKLATQGHFQEAMRFLRNVEGEIAVMMMAAIADRLASASGARKAP
ncbi:hypothetical protein [Roseinatronobacter alkalisoli]|uniref:hypothetical protein n=1 Tax=Roseinatronobacter alkalisoli TaxID=3028235 RepID=UPI002368C841|nr:hypothetical protein [Roseinatronobacter sp. HJB301]